MNKSEIEKQYGISITSIVKLTDKTYKIFTDSETYLLKRHDDEYIENIFVRLEMLSIDSFLLPYMTKYDSYLAYIEDNRYALYKYYPDEPILNKDIRLHFFIKALANLHSSSFFSVNVTDGYFVDKLDFLQKQIDECEANLLSRIKRIEREDYHNPADWYFYMNYQHFHLALNQAKKNLDALDESYKEAKELRLSLTYQNFDYHHILVKAMKIISLDKMSLASPIYDLLFLFEDDVSFSLDTTVFLKEYLSINPLLKYELQELLAFIFIPKIDFEVDIKKDIQSISKCLRYLNRVEKIAAFISSSSLV